MPGWRPDCLRGSVHEPVRAKYRSSLNEVALNEFEEENRGTVVVELQKKHGCGLGLIVSGGTDKESEPQVSSFRPGGIAHRSDALAVGDSILSVNGIKTAGMKHDEIVNLLKNAGEQVLLELEYQLPDTSLSDSLSVSCKEHTVTLVRDGNSFGFTLRGGYHEEQKKTRPLVITHVRPGGPADREGSLKVGDRIVAVNDYNVAHFSLSEASLFMQQCGPKVSLIVEYDVSVMEAVKTARGPLLIEIDKLPGMTLGLGLIQTKYKGNPCMCIDTIQPMSIADRCGALNIGDHIMFIDGTNVDHMSVAEATQLLRSNTEDVIKLEVLPARLVEQQNSRDIINRNGILHGPGHKFPCMAPAASFPAIPSSLSTPSGFGSFSTLHSALSSGPFGRSTQRVSGRKRALFRIDKKQASCMSISSAATSVMVSNQICHAETIEVALCGDYRGVGLTAENSVGECVIISSIQSGSAAERCGVIQEGDRILSINGIDVSMKTSDEVNQMMRDSRHRCEFEIEFDVTESVMPSSGVFVVKLPNHPRSLGLGISTVNKGKELIITSVKKGSIAYRCGSLQAGDKLLAINDIRMEGLNVDDAMHLLQSPEDIIKLKLKREENSTGDETCEESIVYTVELQRKGGPLGITISGTDTPGDPIIISDVIAGGLAERTGAIHISDQLLAVNGDITKGRTLTEATMMLQNAGDLVTLRIARPADSNKTKVKRSQLGDSSTTPVASVDSAMESWDSSCPDMGAYANVTSFHPITVARPVGSMATSKSGSHSQVSNSANGIGTSEEQLADLSYTDSEWDNISNSSQSNKESSGDDTADWVRTFKDYENSDLLKQIGASLKQKSTASLDRRSRSSDGRAKTRKNFAHSTAKNFASELELEKSAERARRPRSSVRSSRSNAEIYQNHVKTIFSPTPVQLYKVKLLKTSAAEDFGFGLSDGMYEKGVYISGVRKGSVADTAGLKQFDRILQINGKRTRDFDCTLTIPLITEAGNKMTMIISRNPITKSDEKQKKKGNGVQPFRDYSSYDENRHYVNVGFTRASVHSPKSA